MVCMYGMYVWHVCIGCMYCFARTYDNVLSIWFDKTIESKNSADIGGTGAEKEEKHAEAIKIQPKWIPKSISETAKMQFEIVLIFWLHFGSVLEVFLHEVRVRFRVRTLPANLIGKQCHQFTFRGRVGGWCGAGGDSEACDECSAGSARARHNWYNFCTPRATASSGRRIG